MAGEMKSGRDHKELVLASIQETCKITSLVSDSIRPSPHTATGTAYIYMCILFPKYERVKLPFCEVTDTPFHLQWHKYCRSGNFRMVKYSGISHFGFYKFRIRKFS